MAIRRVRPSKVLVGTQFSRRDFLKLSGTGLAGAALLGTAGCGSVFERGRERRWRRRGVQHPQPQPHGRDPRPGLRAHNGQRLVRRPDQCDGGPLQARSRQRSPYRPPPRAWRSATDELTYTFTLRDGIQWSNGDPVTSHDYKYAWLKVLNPETAATYAYIISTFVKGADEYNAEKGSAEDVAIETPDDKTLRVNARIASRRSSCSSPASRSTSPSSRSSSRSWATSTPRTRTACSTTVPTS